MSDDGRRWAADKRDFVADARDQAADLRDAVADGRDAIADAREIAADAREAALDQRERDLANRAGDLGELVDVDPAGRAARAADRDARVEARHEREAVSLEREAAVLRRLGGDGPTMLAVAFAEIAERLFDADTFDEVLTRIAEAAVATVAGGELASVTLPQEDGFRTAGTSDERAIDVGKEQYEANEGPSLDALATPTVEAPSFPDERWPVLGRHPADHGVESSVSYRLSAGPCADGGAAIGSLSIYATIPGAFDEAAVEVGAILAAHASLAARAVGERATLDGLARQLERALLSRDVIGQAKGILMERRRTTPEEAFDILRRSSQQLNVKLPEVALRLTETGEIELPKQPD